MKSPILVGIGLVVGLGLPQTASSSNISQKAVSLLSKLGAGEFKAATAIFDDTMLAALPAPKLKVIWEQLEKQLGRFQSTGRVVIKKSARHQKATVTCRFEKDSLDAKVVFDVKGRVAGLFFVPIDTPWAPPAYVDEDRVKELSLQVGWKPQLDGKLVLPTGKGPFAAVVIVHGSGPVDMDGSVGAVKAYRDLAWGLASNGIAVLRFHKRTYQRPRSLASKSKTLTVHDEVVRDVIEAAEALRKNAEIDKDRVFVLGHSLGGELVPRIARDLPWLAGGISMAGRTRPIGELVVDQIEHIASADGTTDAEEKKLIRAAKRFRTQVSSRSLKANDTLSLFGSKTPGSYWLDLRKHDGISIANAVSTPLLFLQGGRDYQVTKADFAGWKNSLAKRPHTSFRLFAALNHLFVAGKGVSTPAEYSVPGHVEGAVVEEIAKWVSKTGARR